MKVTFTDTAAISDHMIEEWFCDIKDDKQVNISNQSQFMKLRLEHLRKTITVEHFDLKGDVVTILENGDMSFMPQGFFDHNFIMAREIMKLAHKNKTILD